MEVTIREGSDEWSFSVVLIVEEVVVEATNQKHNLFSPSVLLASLPVPGLSCGVLLLGCTHRLIGCRG